MLEKRSLPMCNECGEYVEDFHIYCWKCGKMLDLSKNTYNGISNGCVKSLGESVSKMGEIIKEMGDILNKF